MKFWTIKTPGLSHLSYIVGSGGSAAVIDPRRDCLNYLEKARSEGLEITHIFETHRNEDLVSGAPQLAEWTGATVFHGPARDGNVVYAETAHEGDTFEIGDLKIRVLATPGHTDDHLAFALYDTNYPDGAVGVFTGDALFVGDVGRTDFYPGRSEEVAGLLFDSLRKILDLGDQAMIWPAHGAGSVCGSGMADREISTIGHERANNPRLQITDRERFIREKLAEHHYQPPYFRLMERLNLEGGSPPPRTARPRNLSLEAIRSGGFDHIIDIREPGAYCASHLPGSYCIPVSMLPAFAGWCVGEGESVALVASGEDALEKAVSHLVRMGLDTVAGGYTGIIPAAAAGVEMSQIPMVQTQTVQQRMSARHCDWTLLDVRALDEVTKAPMPEAVHFYAGELNERWRELDPGKSYTVMCASGMRATIAASWLSVHGIGNVDVYLGSMGAWKAAQD